MLTYWNNGKLRASIFEIIYKNDKNPNFKILFTKTAHYKLAISQLYQRQNKRS